MYDYAKNNPDRRAKWIRKAGIPSFHPEQVKPELENAPEI